MLTPAPGFAVAARIAALPSVPFVCIATLAMLLAAFAGGLPSLIRGDGPAVTWIAPGVLYAILLQVMARYRGRDAWLGGIEVTCVLLAVNAVNLAAGVLFRPGAPAPHPGLVILAFILAYAVGVPVHFLAIVVVRKFNRVVDRWVARSGRQQTSASEAHASSSDGSAHQ